MPSITSANSVVTLGIVGLYTVPQQLQGYDVDDIYSSENVDNSEVKIGVDGILSAGWIPALIKQNYSLQADSISVGLFEAWYAAEQTAREKYWAFGLIHLPGIGRSYAMTNGILSSYSPMSDAKKVLAPRKFTITWQSVVAAPL
jgi:hypothetical protein